MDDGTKLRLYNTLTRTKQTFRPHDPANVRMYVCGPTVYDFAHVGNARPVIVFDVLFRLLRHLYGPEHVTYVRNITDVDDKINARAAEEHPDLPLNEGIARVTATTERQFHEDVAALGCLKPTVEPRATEHIPEMRAMIERLVERGHAYVAEGHVLFHVPSMPDYGKLSGRSLNDMIAGARVEVAPYKRDPMDFVLWKPSKGGEPAWDSPCGIATPGRPGWHIECSAMAEKHLGVTFDIHGGGIDLVFPHHENEIAQSRCAHGTARMAEVWMHNGFLQVEGAKMSKSLGNFVTIRELLEDWPGEVIRLAMLMTHYRQPIDFTEARLAEASLWSRRWETMQSDSAPADLMKQDLSYLTDSLSNDLDTVSAINVLRNLSSGAEKIKEKRNQLTAGMILLGITQRNVSEQQVIRSLTQENFSSFIMNLPVYIAAKMQNDANMPADFREVMASLSEAAKYASPHVTIRELTKVGQLIDLNELDRMILIRLAARKRKDFTEADRIRDELAAQGIALKDGPDGTTWEVMR